MFHPCKHFSIVTSKHAHAAITNPYKAAPKSKKNKQNQTKTNKNTSKIPPKAGDDQVKRRMAMHKKKVQIMMAVSLFI